MADEALHPGAGDPMALNGITGSNEQQQEDREAEEWIESLTDNVKEKIGDQSFYKNFLGDWLYMDAMDEIDGLPPRDEVKAGIEVFKELLKGVPLKELIKRDKRYKIFQHSAGNITTINGNSIEDGIAYDYKFYTEDQEQDVDDEEGGGWHTELAPVSEEEKAKQAKIRDLALQKAKLIEAELGIS